MSTGSRKIEEVEMRLPKGFGYRREEVDALLKAIEAERDRLQLDLRDASDEIESLRTEVEALRQALAEHESAESANRVELVRARQNLEQERQAANVDRDRILDAAHHLADEIQQRAQRRITEEGWELHRARIERQRFVDSFRALLVKHLEDLDGANGIAPAAAVVEQEIPAEVFAAAASKLFVPPGYTAPGMPAPAQERFTS